MKKIMVMTILFILPFALCSFSEARRSSPLEVESLVYNGVRIMAQHNTKKMGYIQVWDNYVDRMIYEKQIYEIDINPIMEEDVQWIFIASLKLEGEELIVMREDGKQYRINMQSLLKEVEGSCKAKGGIWGRWGESDIECCNLPALDAGKACQSGNECESDCITDDAIAIGRKVTGRCYERAFSLGKCLNIVEGGVVKGIKCSD